MFVKSKNTTNGQLRNQSMFVHIAYINGTLHIYSHYRHDCHINYGVINRLKNISCHLQIYNSCLRLNFIELQPILFPVRGDQWTGTRLYLLRIFRILVRAICSESPWIRFWFIPTSNACYHLVFGGDSVLRFWSEY